MKKIVLLGDSIRQIGYGLKVPQLLGEEYHVWQPADNCRFAQYTLLGLSLWSEELQGADCIHWNNGLWDTCDRFGDGPFTSYEIYEATMLRIAKLLLAITPKVIFATTTPVTAEKDDNNNARIASYNDRLVPKLKSMGVIINDLFALVEPNLDAYIREDHIHLSEEGIDACAAQVAAVIRKAVESV